MRLLFRCLPRPFTAAQAAQKIVLDGREYGVLVHCRTGSSENRRVKRERLHLVHCRTGSSERYAARPPSPGRVHCRTGSSERERRPCCGGGAGSLPHRQLRNSGAADDSLLLCSLPHRQLRKCHGLPTRQSMRSLPHRQLRKRRHGTHVDTPRSLPHRQLRKTRMRVVARCLAFTAA